MEKNNKDTTGYIEKIFQSIVIVNGMSGVMLDEVVAFESGAVGYVIGLGDDEAEVLLMVQDGVKVGQRVVRTKKKLSIAPSDLMRGKFLNSLEALNWDGDTQMDIDGTPLNILKRKNIDEPLETGTLLVDLVVPLAKGQRELVLGDRNTGKTSFLYETVVNQAKNGTLCIYAMVGKKSSSIKRTEEKFINAGIKDNLIMISASASDSSGLNHITPYLAITIAEYFKNKGVNVLVVIDDLTTHAAYYREISLLVRRFPGRNSYPGDVFYVHSRLLERAGGFKEASITCLPVAETVLGDLSGYIQTNLMAMTDGHIFFDKNLIDQGRYPSINPSLSVTRVGLQAQANLFKDISRHISGFLVRLNKIREFMHFGSELSDEVKKTLRLGDMLDEFFNQNEINIVPSNFGAFILAAIWGGFWIESEPATMKNDMLKMYKRYIGDSEYKKKVDDLIKKSDSLLKLTDKVRIHDNLVHAKK